MSTLRSMADGVIATDIVGNITFMNPAAESITGWMFSDARNRVLQEIFPISDDLGRKEIAYKEAEIQNVRKRLMADKAEALQYGGMGMARRMLTILGDVDRAMSGIEEDDQSPVAQGLRLLRNKMWHELQADGVTLIEAKGAEFDPSKMEAIATIPPSDAHPNGTVVDVLEQGYMYKSKVILAARVVVASE